MNDIILKLSAASLGCMVFILFKLLFDYLVTLDKDEFKAGEDEFNRHQLSLFIKLALPISKIFIPLAKNKRFESKRMVVSRRLEMAGFSFTIGEIEFFAVELYYYFVGIIVFFLCMKLNYTLFGLIIGGVMAFYPKMFLSATIKARHLQIMKALPNMLDLLTLSVEAGKDFISSLRDILAKRKNDALNEEFTQTFQEIQLGKKRTEALLSLGKRVGQNDLSSVINAIVQAEELGVSIAELLKIQGDMLRNKRFTMAEKLANEAPVKIIFPIILFIFPAVMIVLFGPILMQAFNMF